MVNNGARFYADNRSIVDAVGRGEIDFGLVNHYYNYQEQEALGDDHRAENYTFPNNDIGSALIITAATVIGNSDNPAAANALIRYLLTEGAQTYFTEQTYEYPLSAGVTPAAVLPRLRHSRLDPSTSTASAADSPQPRRSSRRVGSSTSNRSPAQLGLRLIAGVVAVVFAFPTLYLIWRNISSDADPLGLLFSERTTAPMWRTLRLAFAVAVSTAALGTALAWVTTRTDIPGRRMWQILAPLPLVYPTFIGAASLQRMVNPGGLADDFLSNIGAGGSVQLRGFTGAWLVLTLFTYPYVYLPVAARLRSISGTLEESARMLGDSSWRAFQRIVLPQIATAITTGTLLVFLYTISDFGAVQLMAYDTLSRAIYTTQLSNQPVSLALSFILLTIAALAVFAERLASRRLTTPPLVHAKPATPHLLHRAKAPVTLATSLVLFAALAAPAIAMSDWAQRGIRREASGGRPLTIDAADLWEPTRNTAVAAGLTAVLAILAVLPVAYLAARYRSRAGAAFSNVITSTFALPGILVALSFVFWTSKSQWAATHLRHTLLLLIVAYVVRFGAQAIGAAEVAVSSVPARLNDAARMLGASRGRRFVTVELPILLPGLLAGAGLVLLSTMKELPITLLLAPFDFPTLTSTSWQSFTEAKVAEASITSLILVALSAVLTWLLIIRSADHLK